MANIASLKRVTCFAVLLLLCAVGAARAQAVSDIPTTNTSVTITLGNTFQTIVAATRNAHDTTRQSLTIQNNNASDSCWIFVGALASATKATSILLTTGQAYTRYFPYVPSDAIQATCTNTSDTIYVDTQ